MGSFGAEVAKVYLFLYNVFTGGMWGYVLYILVSHFLEVGPTLTDLHLFYEKVELPLQIAQTLAVMEVIHAFTGLVRSDFFTNLIQVVSRLHVVWIIFLVNPANHSFPFMASAILAWSIAELIRYPFYALSLYGLCPSFLTFLRYSGFLVLYPVGIISEVASCVNCLAFFQTTPAMRQFPSPMPNKWNFEIDLFVTYLVVLATYIPGSYVMYTHMLGQRKKTMQKMKEEAKAKKSKKA
uniref:very-long-chain (3R)-3-hydroxyacyl-CoA dehydratase n=1 Tax=Chromera velia CCMP2878 TaxID=1169474 RepID=A0A0G4I367_9ALVE|mmetsp:Transcript_11067/g.21358  ORF Transcript_11067/g.21358 Transcript_11067/m.21358 type:complete len:238 (-) Transcript_11067:242-955(-)|eukprot:Cvel_10564.t1-p1 / transcript=Cvel_10564.t1 / gene=Cvel_10564 / organism=Chromera_velia_CCMP2878 / gene_product=Very-long-chain (3R)-3-hydroxyacyl-[acyl-carrier, putative / transcript_product=Very-long-chain (3R)-3-hydroxyacyl-[acyl-carrier, putative / location=Cvel_scaffold640:8003-8713(-) / protein_length=237 / sequence_SO=supercontig / SO=protein_coding / is_pseudo=false